MTRAQQPVLTVRTGPVHRSFPPGRDVIVGSDMAADLRIAHPVVGRAHLLLRFEQGGWIAFDNNSPSGIFVDGKRVPLVDIRDGLTVSLARPDGPRVSFEVEQHRDGSIPETDRIPAAERPSHRPPPPARPPRLFRRLCPPATRRSRSRRPRIRMHRPTGWAR